MDAKNASDAFSRITSSVTGYLSSLLWPRVDGLKAPRRPHLPTANDVLIVKDILLSGTKLPLEIIDSIIDHAEYWPHVIARRELKATARGRPSSGDNIEYLRTPPLCFDTSDFDSKTSPSLLPARTIHPCRKIVFSISSNDQGWSSGGHRGTFEQSYTWFDVTREPWSPPQEKGELKHSFLPGPKTLQKNVTAKGEATKHEITWNYWDSLDPDSEEAEEQAKKLGRGRATMNGEFVREMEVGDSVVLWARARFPGWRNTVHKAEIKLFWAV
ncbi:hypothetical protein FQN54_001159 [Arachnomyces sp. PD_36]|nr:hypothetical protein FQN54_001159 [Arachnomyces sp. PD_36]